MSLQSEPTGPQCGVLNTPDFPPFLLTVRNRFTARRRDSRLRATRIAGTDMYPLCQGTES